jgi:alpha-mannosidase
VNNEKYVRYQVLFPSALKTARYVQSIPFGALERPEGIEFPAQDWVDYGDAQHGLALLNGGLPGNLVSEGTLLLSLMRSHNLGAYGFGGGYEPGMSSESGFEINKPLEFRYALLPHRGDWRQAGVYRAGLEFSRPLLVRKLSSHAGFLPAKWGFAEISPSNVVLSSLAPANGGGVIARVYEAAGQSASGVKIKLNAKVAAASVVNLLEDVQQPLAVRDDGVQVDLRPFEIKTIRVEF